MSGLCKRQGCGERAERRVVLRLNAAFRDHRLCVNCALSLMAYAVRQGLRATVDVIDDADQTSAPAFLGSAQNGAAVKTTLGSPD